MALCSTSTPSCSFKGGFKVCCSSRTIHKSTVNCRVAAPRKCLQRASRRDVFLLSLLSSLGTVSGKARADIIEEGQTVYIDLETDTVLTPGERQVLLNNLKIQRQNRVPEGFPSFVRDGFNIKVLANGFTQDESGLIYNDTEIGSGTSPVDGQEVTFDYEGFNESGARIDSSYNRGYPSKTRLGNEGLIPGFEIALKGMKVGGRRRIIIPPELGPPVGPSTFFSAKQCEVFDVELVDIKSCRETSFAMFSGVTCE